MAAAIFAYVSLFTAGLSLAGDEKPKYNLPAEIRNLSESARPEPARTVLDFDCTSYDIADTAKAVIWLEFTPNPKGGIQDIEVAYSSHPGHGLEHRAILALKSAEFNSMALSRGGPATWFYHEVVFDRDMYMAWRTGFDTAVVADSTEYLPGPDEFVALEQFPEMIVRVEPEHPPELKSQGVSGTVWVCALIGRNGNVWKVTVGKSSGNAKLDEAAVTAAYKCRFRPACQNGQPIAGWVTYRVNIGIDSTK